MTASSLLALHALRAYSRVAYRRYGLRMKREIKETILQSSYPGTLSFPNLVYKWVPDKMIGGTL